MDSKDSTHATRQSSTCVDQTPDRKCPLLPTTSYSFETNKILRHISYSFSISDCLEEWHLGPWLLSLARLAVFRSAWSRLAPMYRWSRAGPAVSGLGHTERAPPALLLRAKRAFPESQHKVRKLTPGIPSKSARRDLVEREKH